MRAMILWMVLLGILSCSLAGCFFLFEQEDCPQREMVGSMADYTTESGELDGVWFHEPQACGEGSDFDGGHVIRIEGLGPLLWRYYGIEGCPAEDESVCQVVRDSFLPELIDQIREEILEVRVNHYDLCSKEQGVDLAITLSMQDWTRVDQVVGLIAEALREAELGESVMLLVGPEQVHCE
ncbi:MAG: hypothetical protein JRF33_25665 [Deltaproteobacteria bacterium]|nr:hypothetical protein [Deltaproteobacteria bacterium]